MIKINQIKLSINASEEELKNKIRKLLRFNKNEIFNYTILKKSIDARKKDNLMYIYSVSVSINNINENKLVKMLNNKDISIYNEERYSFPEITDNNPHKRTAIIGSGPAGLFCGLFLARAGILPTIYERGLAVHERTKIVNAFW